MAAGLKEEIPLVDARIDGGLPKVSHYARTMNSISETKKELELPWQHPVYMPKNYLRLSLSDMAVGV